MRKCLTGLLYLVRINDRAHGGLMAVLTLLPILALTGPLTAIHANGALARPTEEEPTDPPAPLNSEQVRFDHISTEDGL
jgi:hypothetical protein